MQAKYKARSEAYKKSKQRIMNEIDQCKSGKKDKKLLPGLQLALAILKSEFIVAENEVGE